MFKRMVNVVEVLALIGAAVFILLLFTNEPDTSGTYSGNAPPGAVLFQNNCVRCHGAKGEGQLGPQLSDGKVAKAFPHATDEVAFVTHGQGGMPAFGKTLSPAQIQQVVGYTRTL
jgi:cytochrome c6